MVEEVKEEEKADLFPSGIKRGKGDSSKLNPREVMLIRRLWFGGWSDYQIWKEYRISIPAIQKAKNEIERQATEEFENKEQHAVELAMFKERLKFVIDNMDSIAKEPNVSHADRIKSESVKLEALAMLRYATEASIASPDPHTALKKIVEQSSSRQVRLERGSSH
jgi:hypothetical protein